MLEFRKYCIRLELVPDDLTLQAVTASSKPLRPLWRSQDLKLMNPQVFHPAALLL